MVVVHEAMEVQLNIRKSQHFPTKRANAATSEVIGAWFDKFESVLGRILWPC